MGFIALQRAKLHYVFENVFHVVERLVSEKEAKMNKIFKVIWSKSKQCYVVVSELAKNTTGKKKIVVASILAALVAGQAMQVEAGGSFTGPSTTKGIAISAGGGITASATGNNSIAIGGATANENGAIAIGSDTSSQQNAVSIGWGSTGAGYGSIALGTTTEKNHVELANINKAVTSTGDYAISIGAGAQSNGDGAMALGVLSSAKQGQALAIGRSASADGVGSFAAGLQTKATGAGSIAIGGATSNTTSEGATASGQAAIAIGNKATASQLNALAIGTNANAKQQNATAIGSGATVEEKNATAVGNDTKAKKQYDNAFGYTSTASGGAATAVGYYATASGNQTVALGSTINSTAQYATGIGYSVNSQGEGSVAIGAGVDALSASSPAKQVQATRKNAIAIGRATQATGESATAIGTDATASSSDAVAIGRLSNASGGTSISFGYNTKATHTNAVAIGTDVSATEESAIALGRKTKASALNATAVGPLAEASENSASAFGMSASAANEGSLALGNGASATVDNGVALGSGSKANVGSGTPGFNPHASRNDPYTNLSGNTLTSTWGAVAVGDGTNTRQIIGVAAGTNDTDAVNVAQLKALNLAFTTDGNAGDVNLTNTLSVNGDTDYIATSGGTGQLTISGKIKDISVDTNGTATASKGLANAANVATAINNANAAQTIKYKANGTGNNSVKLSDGLNFTNGTTTTSTVGANGQVSFDLNTATKQSITDSATAVARTISLGGDTGTTTAKSLTSGNVNFGVKSGSPTYLTTTANSNDVTLTINEQAIKNAAKDASSFKVKANATAAEDVKGGDTVAFNDGDNIAITQTGKTFKIATAKNVTFDAATIGGNTTIGSTGVTTNKVTVGNISIDGTDGINAGGKAITHVGTGRVSNSSTDDGNVANIGDVKAIANNAVANLSTELGITDGTTSGTSTVNLKTEKLKVVGTGVAKTTVNGQTITVDVAKGTLTNNTTTGALTGTAGVVDANDMATAVNTAITKAVDTATGTQKLDISAGGTDSSVNLKTQKLTVAGTGAATASLTGQTITVNVAEGTLTPNTTDGTASATAGVAKAVDVAAAINNANSVLGNKITAATQSLSTLGDNKFKLTADSTSTTGQALNKSGGLSFKIAGDGDLVSTSATTDTINVTVKKGTLTNAADGSLNVTDSGVVTADNMKSVVNDAITKAVTSAKDGSAWNISTNGGTATKVSGGNTVDLINGDNIEITQDGTDGKKITVKTKKDLTLDSVTAANTVKVGSGTNLITLDGTSGAVSANTFTGTTFTAGAASMNATGFRLTGGPSVTTTGIDAGSAAITNVASGGTTGTNAANIADVKQIAKDTVTNAVNNLSSTLTVTDGTTDGNVSLKTDKLKIVGTGAAKATVNGQTITVDVAKGTIAANSTTGALTGTAGVVDANDMATAVNTAITKAVDNATGTQALNLTDGTNTGSVKLSTQTLSVSGTNGVQATVGGQGITIGLDTATKNLISNSSTAVDTLGKNTFTLKADSTDTTAQALNKSGGLAFKVAGDSDLVSTSATADTVKVTVKKGTLTTNADGTLNKATDGVVTADNMTTVVNDAITKAVTSAKDGSAWNISTNGGTATKVSGGNTVDLINGDNIEITQDSTDGKKITVKTKKDLTVDSVTAANTVKVGSGTNLITLDGSTGAVSGNTFTAGNASMNTTGFRLTGGPSVTTTGIDAGNKVITNVASGGTTSTNAANIGDVNDKVTSAINNLTTNLTKNTSISYTANNDTPVKTVSLNDGFKFTNGTLTTAEVAAGGVVKFNVTQGTLSTDTNGTVSAGTTGVATTSDVASAVNSAVTAAVTNATGNQKLDISAGGTDSSVNLKTQKLTVTGTGAATTSVAGQTITVNVAEGTFTNKSDGTTSATAGVAKATDVAAAINNTNTVLNQKIADATTSLGTLGNNTFTLKADSTDTSAQNLNKSGGLAFKVAGDGDLVSTSATTDAVKVTVKKGTLSTNADGTINKATDGVVTTDNMTTVVNDAITKAVTSAKDGSAWNISTNGGTATKVSGGNTVDLINGDNIEITQDGTDGKKITVKTKKDLTLDSVTAANTVKVGSGTNLITLDGTSGAVSANTFTGTTFTAGAASMNATGFRLTGGPSVTTTGIDAGSAAITNVASGGTTGTNAANIADVKQIAKDTVTNAVNNLSSTLTVTDGTTDGNVSLKTDKLKIVGTGAAKATVNGQTITVDVAKGTIAANSTTGALTGTAGVVDANDMATAVNTAITKAVDNATGTQALNLTDGTNTGSVKLSTQTLSVSGTNGVQATVGGQGITIGLDTATKNLISNSSTAVDTLGKNTFTLKADSTDTTAQALNKSGGLAFKVAGDSDLVSTSATADTVKVTVKKGTLTTNADGTLNKATDGVVTADNMTTVVNDAITKAVTSAKDGSAWNISTNGGTATKVSGGNTVDLINGDNIEITQDSTDGKKITVKTKKDLTVDSVTAANTVKVGSGTNLITLDGSTGAVSGNTFTAGNASMNTTGFRVTGGPSMTTTGIDAGNTVITNVASGGTTSTNAANIGDITKAISDLTTNLTKNTSISYTANTTTPGQTVSLKDGFNFSNGTLTTAEVAANGVVKFNVTQGSLSTDGNGNITNTAGVATTDDVKNAVNTAINKAVTNSSAAVNTLGANTFTLKADSTDTTAQNLNKSGGLAFKVAGDGNFITTSAAADTVTVSIKQGTFGSNTDGTAKSTTNGVATTNDVANIVNTTVTNAVTKAAGAQVLNITDGNNNGSINLKNDALKVVGTDGVTTEVNGKTITVGLDTATKDKINNASVATNKNISLAADTGTTSSQSLKDGDVSFAVKGASGDYISTNMNGSTVEISTKRATINSNAATGEASVTGNDGLATAKNVADAINAATAKAVSQSAWKLAADGTTGTETISGGDTVNFKAGSNMEVSRTGKDITYKTKDNVAFTTVTAGTGANEVKLDGNTGTVTAKDITATGDVTAKNVTTSGNVTAAGTVKGDTVQGNTVKAGNVTITGGTTNTITGLSNTTWTGSTTTPDRAATEGQLQQAISSATSSATFKFDGDNNSQQTMNLQNGTFKVTGDTMITTNATSAGIGLSLNTNNVKIAYAANGLNGQTTSIASGFNFTDGDHTKATVGASGVVKYDAKTSTISVANGHATASGNDLATADNVADAINQMTQNNSGNTTQLRQDISKVATETQRVGAHAAAMAALKPIQYDPLAPTQIMAGVGNYRGESAAALGIAHYTNDNTMFNVGVSVGGNHNMINAGVTHKFGISAEKKNIPDRYKAGPISSIYVMQDEMTQLRSENEAYKAKLDKQQSEIDALKAAVDQLLASKA
mgnify:CR=1 FL=1